LLDEISPSGKAAGRPLAPPDTGSMAGIKLPQPSGGVIRGSMGVQQIIAPDPWAGLFGGLALGGGLFLLFALFALIAAVSGAYPDAVSYFDKDNGLVTMLGIGVVVVGLFGAFGKLISASVKR
jgi:hypothetical protein